ncbi:recombinase family protein [Spirillospora sp. CA-294931]|uniref:recombinase family protein n=1 Tax=Spirillospora sp. CA-294931 TaxID=3240042 RepID=UPI003D900B61
MTSLTPATAYARKSHKGQARQGRREISVTDQLREINEEAPDYAVEVVETFHDNESAWSDTTREGWDATLASLDAPDSPRVLILHAIDRMSRQGGYTAFAEDIKRRVAMGELRVIGLLDDYDSSRYRDPQTAAHELDKLLISAKQYSDKLARRIRAAKTRTRDGGGHVGKPAFGWQVADVATGKLERQPDEWPTVERIFRAVAGGQGLRAVARELNAEGLRTRRGAEWSSRTLHGMLRNPLYEGFLSRADKSGLMHRVLDDTGEPVGILAPGTEPLAPQLVTAARASLSGRTHHGAGKQGLANADLTGILKCAGCGGPMVSSGTRYRCGRNARGGDCLAPANAMHRAIEPVMWSIAAHVVVNLSPEDETDLPIIIAISEAWGAVEHPEQEDNSAEAHAAVKEAQAAVSRITRNARLGVYDTDEKALISDLATARTALAATERRLAEIEGGKVRYFPWLHADLTMHDLLTAWAGEPPHRRRAILATVIAEARVTRAATGVRRFDASRVAYRVQGTDEWVTAIALNELAPDVVEAREARVAQHGADSLADYARDDLTDAEMADAYEADADAV